jgi:predicted amidophosphoribosyltransferase
MSQVWLPVPCVICGQPPRQLCSACDSSLVIRPRAITRIIGLTGWAVADYSGEVSSLVRAFKASGSRVLQRYLAREMAVVLAGQFDVGQLGLALPSSGREKPIWLIPAPSSRASLKTRGFVPAKQLARAVARELRASGFAGARVIDFLRIQGRTRDQAGLGKSERFENLRGKMTAAPNLRASKALASTTSSPNVVLIDDIVTTGATLLEMRRSLLGVGLAAEFFVTFAETL